MTLLSKILKTSLPATLVFLTHTNPAHAECARNDIDYYLSKGFSTEQITAICTSSVVISNQNNNQVPLEPTVSDGPQNTGLPIAAKTSNNENELFLKDAINGRNVVLTDQLLQYTLKICIEHADEDQYGFAPKTCPQVKFEIALNGLEILGSGKRYIIYGDNEVQIKSSITREIIDGLNNLKPEARSYLLKKLESGNKTSIPIRDDIPLDTVVQLLKKLAI